MERTVTNKEDKTHQRSGIYKLASKDCDKVYVRQIYRILLVWMKEYQGRKTK